MISQRRERERERSWDKSTPEQRAFNFKGWKERTQRPFIIFRDIPRCDAREKEAEGRKKEKRKRRN